jgi:transposase InsO family protein
LPLSNGHDSILTITNHDCSKAAIFIPCLKEVNAEGVAHLYAQYVFPHYGVPQKVISDWDPRFTAKFMRELCKQLHIDQNISSAYHPQTDGKSEWTNQWLEQYLCMYGNFQQNDWASWLPLAQFVHNAWPSD